MNQSYQPILSQLGRGDSIDQICKTLKLSREQFDQNWHAECRRRVPKDQGTLHVDGLRRSVHIKRDQRGLAAWKRGCSS
jgi:hypothetical protein